MADCLIAAVMLGLFVLACLNSATRQNVTIGFDEQAHISYVAHIQTTSDAWPDLRSLRLVDPQSFRFTGEANYLNHPPIFYDLLAAIGPVLEAHPQAVWAYRVIDIALVAAGFAVLLALALSAQFSRLEFYAYSIPLAFIPVLVQLAATVNNDDLAFLGGALAMLGVWQLVASGRSPWLVAALAGVIIAGWAKLTGLLLTAGLMGATLAYLLWRGRLRWSWTIAAAVALAAAAAPYIVYIAHYGSPAPETSAQLALLNDGTRAAGWADLPRKSFPSYAAFFAVAFIADWMPVIGVRSILNEAMLAFPIAALACAAAGVAISLQRLWCRHETTRDVVVVAGAVALAATFAIHITFSYGRHVATGSLLDVFPRYYFPLAAIVPLAALSLASAIDAPRWRAGLLAFLIAGPVLLRIFGVPVA